MIPIVAAAYFASFLLSVMPDACEQLPPGASYSQLAGRVVQSTTGSALAYANVVVVGTTKGAMTGDDGRFLIEAIEPGAYYVKAMTMGYRTEFRLVYVARETRAVANFRLSWEPVAEMPRIDVFGRNHRPHYYPRPDSVDAVTEWSEEQLELWEIQRAYWRHLRDRDLMSWVGLFHPGFQLYHLPVPPRPDLYSIIDRAGNFLATMQPGSFKFVLTDPQVLVMKDTAVIHYRCAWTATMADGSRHQSNEIHTHEWRQMDDQWWLFRAQGVTPDD